YQALGPCAPVGTPYTLTAADLAATANASAPTTICQVDRVNAYGVINPDIKRFGVSGRVTANVADNMQVYGELNFMQSTVSYTGFPATIRGNANTGILYPRFSTQNNPGGANAPGSGLIALPIYVCP